MSSGIMKPDRITTVIAFVGKTSRRRIGDTGMYSTDGKTLVYESSFNNPDELIAWWVDDEIFCTVGDSSNILILNGACQHIKYGTQTGSEPMIARGKEVYRDGKFVNDTLYINGVERGWHEVINLHEVCK